MAPTTYLNLPVDTLLRLLTIATTELVQVSDAKKPDAIIEFPVRKKQVQLLWDTIEERKAMDEEETLTKRYSK